MHKGKNRIRKRGSARLSAAIFLLSAGMLQMGVQGVSASEADFFTEEVILSGEEETPQTEQEPRQAEQAAENPQHGQNIQSGQDTRSDQNTQSGQNARSEQNIQSGQDALSGQNIQSGKDARDAQSSTKLPDQAGSRKPADTDPAQRGEGEEGEEKKENTKSGEADGGKNAGQQFYTPDAAAALQTQKAAGAEKAGGAVQGQTQTDQSEAEQPAQQPQEKQSKAERPAKQIRPQADTQTRENWEDILFWGMLFVAVGLFSAGTYRLRANTFMRW